MSVVSFDECAVHSKNGWNGRMMEDGYARPEDAALASYPPKACARVIRVEAIDEAQVDVIVDTEPSHLMRVYCRRRGGLWYDDGDIVE